MGQPFSSDKLPVRMLHDRVLVATDVEDGERRSSAGIVRLVQEEDRVLYDPADKAEVELRGDTFVLLRERDIHAVAAERLGDGQPGLYL